VGILKTSYEKLYIYTFGDLLVRREEDLLFSGRGTRLNKEWRLFLMLLFRRGETLSYHYLIDRLDLDKNVTPKQSLRTLVYRLRKELNISGCDFILSEEGGYSFNTDSCYWLDSRYFAGLVEKAREARDEDEERRSLDFYRRALDLYRGGFLDGQKLKCKQIIDRKQEYRQLYIEAVQEAGELHAARDNYDEAIDLYETALQIHPYSLELYLDLVTTFKKQGRPDMALIRAEEAASFLKNSHMELPSELELEIRHRLPADRGSSPAEFLDHNIIENERIMECGPLTFNNFYALEKRRAERSHSPLHLVQFRLTEGESPARMREAEVILREVLEGKLRSADIVSRWKPRHFMLLISGMEEEEIGVILERIDRSYRDSFPPSDVNLSYEYEEV